MMVKDTRLADGGTEMAAVELDDFTLEVVDAGLAALLHEAATSDRPPAVPVGALSREARQRRQRVLTRLRH